MNIYHTITISSIWISSALGAILTGDQMTLGLAVVGTLIVGLFRE